MQDKLNTSSWHEAFAELQAKHQKSVRTAVAKFGKGLRDPDEVIDRVWSKLWVYWCDHGSPPANPGAWLYTVATNEALEYLRREASERRRRLDSIHRAGFEPDDDPARQVEREDPLQESKTEKLLDEVRQSKKRLDIRLRMVIELEFDEGKSQGEIAKRLGLTRGGVTKRKMKAIAIMRENVKLSMSHNYSS